MSVYIYIYVYIQTHVYTKPYNQKPSRKCWKSEKVEKSKQYKCQYNQKMCWDRKENTSICLIKRTQNHCCYFLSCSFFWTNTAQKFFYRWWKWIFNIFNHHSILCNSSSNANVCQKTKHNFTLVMRELYLWVRSENFIVNFVQFYSQCTGTNVEFFFETFFSGLFMKIRVEWCLF